MRLQERIDTINVVRIPRLTDGHANTIGDFYTQVIGPMLPTREVVLAWQGLIYDYASDPDAIFFLRRYQSASRKDWTAIRRGFLTEYARGGYVCCDNFFAHYFYAMAIDGFVPTLEELKGAIQARTFPYGFMSTSEERELQAFRKGKQPRLNEAGWKLAHLVPVNGSYLSVGDGRFVDKHFPRGERTDWQVTAGGYYARTVPREMTARERAFLTAHFIRLASPINYFLVPKQANERDACGNNIGEDEDVLSYVSLVFRERYGRSLEAFAHFADAPEELLAGRDTSRVAIEIEYRSGTRPFNAEMPTTKENARTKQSSATAIRTRTKRGQKTVSKDQLHQMARLYLEKGLSFRELERVVLGIDSKARGGGFVAKIALNAFGITVREKGMLANMTPEAAVVSVTGPTKDAIREVYGI